VMDANSIVLRAWHAPEREPRDRRLMMGASPDSVVRGYRKTVKADARRLLK
jgi:hypothetical protein